MAILRIAVFNKKTNKEVVDFPIRESDGKDITKFRWDTEEDFDAEFQADMNLIYTSAKVHEGLYLSIVREESTND